VSNYRYSPCFLEPASFVIYEDETKKVVVRMYGEQKADDVAMAAEITRLFNLREKRRNRSTTP
jgi:hypothetical protein